MNGQPMPSGMSEQEREDVLAASEFITIQMDLYNRYVLNQKSSINLCNYSSLGHSAECWGDVGTSASHTTGTKTLRWARAHASIDAL